MFVPKGLTQEYVLERLEQTVRLLSPSFVFGYWDLEDIRQEARIFGLEALPRYESGGFREDGEPVRALENFLFAHIRNRLLNLLRDKYRRTDPPCTLCHQGRQAEHNDKQVCTKYKEWRKRNNAKANLARPLDIAAVPDDHEPNMHEDSAVEATARLHEATSLLDEKLPAELRSDYLRLKAGERLTRVRRERVETACRKVLADLLRPEEPEATL